MPRRPFRSPLLGSLLLAAGATLLMSIFVVDWRPGNQAGSGAVQFVLACLFLAPVLMIVGTWLIRRDAAAILSDARTRPVVYLRPFSQEEVSSPGNLPWKVFVERYRLHPIRVLLGTMLIGSVGQILGWLMQLAGAETLGTIWIVACLAIVYSMILYAIFYVWRAIRGRVDVTLEQELCHHLGQFGPVVAVGEPGELFAPAGGARVYLDDDSWQSVVLDSIARARIIVVHLVPEGWTWWEFVQSISSHDPTRVIAVVVGRFFTDESYAAMRVKVQQELGITLGEKRDAFDLIAFDQNRTPIYLTQRWIPWLFWPLRSYRLSRSTFQPFLDNQKLVYRFSVVWWRNLFQRQRKVEHAG